MPRPYGVSPLLPASPLRGITVAVGLAPMGYHRGCRASPLRGITVAVGPRPYGVSPWLSTSLLRNITVPVGAGHARPGQK